MRVSVNDQVRAGVVDRLREQVRTQERIYFAGLSLQRLGHGGVVHESQLQIHVVQFAQGRLETVGGLARMPDERLHLRLAELGSASTCETAAEAFDAGDADPALANLARRRVALEHMHAAGLEAAHDRLGKPRLVIMVAENGEDGHRQIGEFPADHIGLLQCPTSCQVTGEKKEIRLLRESCEPPAVGASGGRPEVDVAYGSYPNHDTCSDSAGSG